MEFTVTWRLSLCSWDAMTWAFSVRCFKAELFRFVWMALQCQRSTNDIFQDLPNEFVDFIIKKIFFPFVLRFLVQTDSMNWSEYKFFFVGISQELRWEL